MAPAVFAEEAAGSEETVETQNPVVDFEQVSGSVYGRFDFNESAWAAVSVVNGHDYLFIPHHRTLFVYDLDEWKKVDEEIIGLSMGHGCLIDSNGIAWIYGTSDRMYRYDPVTGEGSWTSVIGIEGATQINDVIEINGKFYLGTYNIAKLVEYDPVTDTFTDLGRLSEEARAYRVHPSLTSMNTTAVQTR